MSVVLRLVRSAVAPLTRTRLFRAWAPRLLPPVERLLDRLSRGRIQLSALLVPSLVLRSTGARTGAVRETRLMYTPDGRGRAVVAGTSFARARHPAWTYNLMAHPDAVIVVRGRPLPVRASLIGPEGRDEAWDRIERQWPGYRAYERDSGRTVRLFLLRPVAERGTLASVRDYPAIGDHRKDAREMTNQDNTAGGLPGTDEPRLVRTESGPDLVLVRNFAAGIEEVWATLTDPARTAEWYGPWEGEAGAGRTIRVQMRFEDGDPWLPMRIDACDRPTRLAVSMLEEQGDWRLELLLTETAGTTRLSLIHHLTGVDGLGEIGPGWEYYLDLFGAALRTSSTEAGSLPEFTDYYPARAEVFSTLAETYTRGTPTEP